ncbi:MAG: hypothetical protein V3V08_05730 [Nannocystaceae bacterium]
MTDIFAWECSPVRGVASFTTLKGVDGQVAIDIIRGRAIEDPFPTGAFFEMDADFRRDVKLSDQHLTGEGGMVLIGPAPAEFIRSRELPNVRLLPVSLHDHKGRIASEHHHLLHTTTIIDCIDPQASGAMWNAIDPSLMAGWSELVLQPDLDPLPPLFRAKHVEHLIFLREDLASALGSAGFEGTCVLDLDEVH